MFLACLLIANRSDRSVVPPQLASKHLSCAESYSRCTSDYERGDVLDHRAPGLYCQPMNTFWFLLWRMVGWLIGSGVALGVVIASLIEIAILIQISGDAVGGVEEVVGALGRGVLIGGFFGVPPGIVCGLALAILTLGFRRLPERCGRYRIIAAAVSTGVVLVPAGLLALLANDYEGVGGMMLMPTYFQMFGIPLLISAPFAALAAQSVAKAFSRRASAEPR